MFALAPAATSWETTSSELALMALDHLRCAVVIVRGNSEVVLTNSAARAVLRQHDGLAVANGRLTAQNDLTALIARAARTGQGGPLQIYRPSGRRPFEAVVTPMGEAVAVFLSDPTDGAEPSAALIARMYGLTFAETRVTVLLMQGRSLEEASAELHIAKETARKHLRSIFEKTDTCRQSELVRLLVSGPANLRFADLRQ